MRLSLAKDLEPLRTAARAKIDAEAEALRLRYITPGEGQAMVYQQKAAEAEVVVSLPIGEAAKTDFPVLAAEIGPTVPPTENEDADLRAAAQVVLNMRAMWAGIAAAIEALRLTAKNAVAAGGTPAEIEAASNVSWP
ncbi:hypothetical protein [Inquilinus sp. OTU3971]|uniref:hypothetical protein n=1 Tax=Inquilinus sp. OTU3971 TaxID=3043855 RepID=UPI00313E24B7